MLQTVVSRATGSNPASIKSNLITSPAEGPLPFLDTNNHQLLLTVDGKRNRYQRGHWQTFQGREIWA